MATFRDLIDKAYTWFNAQAATGGATAAKQDTQEASLNAIQAAVEGTLNISDVGKNASAFESVTVADSAIGLTSATYGVAVAAFITCETAQVRFRVDGSDPTSAEGHLLNVGDTLELNSAADLATFKAIRTGATSGVLKATYSGVA